MQKKEHEVKLIKISDILPNDWNTNRQDAARYRQLKKRIEKVGLTEPIEVILNPDLLSTDKYVIIDGYHRWKVCKELGWKEMFCTVVDTDAFPSKHELMKETLAKNRIGGEDDKVALKEQMELMVEEEDLGEICEETGLDFESTEFLLAEDFSSYEEREEKIKEERQESDAAILKIILPTDLKDLEIDEDLKHDVIKYIRQKYGKKG